MRLLAMAVAFSAAASSPSPSPAPPASATAGSPAPSSSAVASLSGPLAQLAFLIGTWEGEGGGKDATGSGGFAFRVVNQGHAVLRTNVASYPATADRPAYRHEDTMIAYADGGGARADYCDSEDHVIHYRLEPIPEGGLRFVSDAAAPGPRYRLTYRPTGAGAIEGTFEVAAPGAPEAFKPFLTWTARRTRE
jgi:hypothetical protein